MNADSSSPSGAEDGPEAFVSRLGAELESSDVRPIVFVLGSGLSNAIIPGVGRMTTAGMDFLGRRSPDAVLRIVEEFADAGTDPNTAALRYERVLSSLDSYVGPEYVKGFVQELTLSAYAAVSPGAHGVLAGRRRRYDPLEIAACGILENDIEGWQLPRGIRALGVLAAQHPERFSRAITTNFDPLLEIAVRRAHRASLTVSFDKDGSLHPLAPSPVFAVGHLHGYWDGGTYTLHTGRRLKQPRPQLVGSLKDLMSGALVVVMGYGGWNDVFSALRG